MTFSVHTIELTSESIARTYEAASEVFLADQHVIAADSTPQHLDGHEVFTCTNQYPHGTIYQGI